MSYNYSRGWLDSQADLISQMVELARSSNAAMVEFSDYDEADRFRFRVRNILASLALHYPDYADVCSALRTWKEIDRINSVMRIYIGTESNYTRPSHAKGSHGRTIKLKGIRPTGPTLATTYAHVPSRPQPKAAQDTPAESVLVHTEPPEPDDILGAFHALGLVCKTVKHSRVIWKNCNITADQLKDVLGDEQVARDFNVMDFTMSQDGKVMQLELNYKGPFV